jgi:hypothetical protein
MPNEFKAPTDEGEDFIRENTYSVRFNILFLCIFNNCHPSAWPFLPDPDKKTENRQESSKESPTGDKKEGIGYLQKGRNRPFRASISRQITNRKCGQNRPRFSGYY